MENQEQNPKLEEAKNKFLIGMSKAIQSSMKNVIKNSDLIKRTGLSAQQEGYINAIYADAHKLSWIVNDILDFCRLELGKVDLQAIDFNIEYLINDIFRKAIEQKKDHPIDTYIDIDKEVPRELVGDPTRLRQILVNLLSNAFKFTEKGEIGIIVRKAGHSGTEVGDTIPLRIIVKDSGIGISRERQEKVFDFDGREDPAKSWDYGGTGLGLSICKLIVESMDGTIMVDSEEGKGSEFIVNLPFVKGKPASDRGVYPLSRNELVGKKAIIVDDNEIARKILNKCCETMGIDVQLITASPKAVLEFLDSSLVEGDSPDLILCDLMMPEMDGYELARTIRANDGFRDIKLIAVTSAVRVGGAKNAQDCGFNGFLPKPVFLDELAKVIATVLGSSQEGGPIITRHMVEELRVKNIKVLTVINSQADQQILNDCFGSLSCEGEYAPGGQKAIEYLKEKIYNLCLLDFDILKGEGFDIVRVMKEVSRSMPVVVLMSTDAKDQKSRCLDAGVDDFLAKPIDMISLKRVISRYADK